MYLTLPMMLVFQHLIVHGASHQRSAGVESEHFEGIRIQPFCDSSTLDCCHQIQREEEAASMADHKADSHVRDVKAERNSPESLDFLCCTVVKTSLSKEVVAISSCRGPYRMICPWQHSTSLIFEKLHIQDSRGLINLIESASGYCTAYGPTFTQSVRAGATNHIDVPALIEDGKDYMYVYFTADTEDERLQQIEVPWAKVLNLKLSMIEKQVTRKSWLVWGPVITGVRYQIAFMANNTFETVVHLRLGFRYEEY